MGNPEPPPIDPERLAKAVRDFEAAVEDCASPLDYAVPPTEEQFRADKAKLLRRWDRERLINGF